MIIGTPHTRKEFVASVEDAKGGIQTVTIKAPNQGAAREALLKMGYVCVRWIL